MISIEQAGIVHSPRLAAGVKNVRLYDMKILDMKMPDQKNYRRYCD
jgi:hypothetical protein